MMFPFLDIHSHDPSRYNNAIINISPYDEMHDDAYYSVGIHPWDTPSVNENMLKRLSDVAKERQVVAIGETGLDALRGGNLSLQEELFRFHISLSEQLKKPLIIHAVKTFPQIIQIHKNINPSMPWIIHGFRGKPQLAEELLRHGFYISLGEKFNTETAKIIPADKLLFESDESTLTIEEIISRITK